MARIEAVVRRRKRAEVRLNAWPVLHAELEIRSDQYQAFVGGQSLGLTRREFELLQLLAEVPGQVVEREEIYQKVWGYAMAHGDRSVDVFVRKLRQKLQQPLAGLALHPHPFRDRLPLRSRAAAPFPSPRSGDEAETPPRKARRSSSTSTVHSFTELHSNVTTCPGGGEAAWRMEGENGGAARCATLDRRRPDPRVRRSSRDQAG